MDSGFWVWGFRDARGAVGLIRDVPHGFETIYAMPFVIFGLAFLIFFRQKDLMTKNNYRWFTAINVLLALNVLGAVIIRFPWRWRQSGFPGI